MTGPCRSAPVLAGLLTLLAACGAGSTSATTSPAGPPTPSLSSPASEAPSASDSASASPVPSASSSAGPSPTSTPSVDVVAGDIDGDGKPDRLSLRTAAGKVVLVADLTRDGHQTLALGTAPAAGPPAGIVGNAAVDADGTRVVFIQVSAGAAVSVMDLVALVGGRLTLARSGGAPFQVAVGGTVGSDNDFGCPGPPRRGLVLLAVASVQEAGGPATGTLDYYRLAGGQVVLTHSDSVSAPSVAAAAARYRALTNRCGLSPAVP